MFALTTNDNNYTKLYKILVNNGILSKDKLKEISRRTKEQDSYLSQILLADETLPQQEILDVLAKFFNLPTTTLADKTIAPQVINLIPKELAEQQSIIVFKKKGEFLDVATAAPENQTMVEFIKKKTGLKPDLFIATPQEIKAALKKYKSDIGEEFGKIIKESTREALAVHDSAEKMAHYVPIINMVNSIIEQALAYKASDIHVEPFTDKVIIRFRIDGMLHNIVKLPKEVLPPLITRIKLLADLKIDEHRRPQDGRFQYNYYGSEIAIRVAIIPTLHGSKASLRLLEMKQKEFTLRKLGLNRRDFDILKKEITASQGMILATGPTGSGKTTTLYTLLRMLNNENVNICTIEDPIEYGIDGINQTQINPNSGLTFATGLRSLLRHDPNIVMVGEIRDAETANMAVNAAMTGHLVLSTLHTNNAFLASQRLVEMGVKPYLVSPVVNLIIGQRLVRKICPNCKIKIRAVDKLFETYQSYFDFPESFKKFKSLKLLPAELNLNQINFFRGRGCKRCNNSGYLGRIGIYEILKIDDDLRKTILNDTSEDLIKKQALAKGALTMAEDGLLKIFLGRTTFEEVLRVTKD